jgi:aryl-alcohol dehydrogenase-like predicted oxidoreductase
LRASLAGLGCNAFGARIDEEQTGKVIGAALDEGVTFFDTARTYGGGRSEEFMGRALVGHRDEVVLATKFGYESTSGAGPGSRRELELSVETSLRALRTDRIDLLQLHRPDPTTPLEETLAGMTNLVRQGKVLYVGCSNFAGWQLADAAWLSRTHGYERFVSVQNRWNLLERGLEEEVRPACERFGCGVLPFFPLASGFLTGKVRRGHAPAAGTKLANPLHAPVLAEHNFTKLERVEEWARAHDRSVLDVALSWLASQPVVASVISGASSPEHVRANVAATRADLTASDLAEIDELTA